MDKRYFLIIAIIVICCFNLYMIANFSDIVGDASIDVGNYTFSLPQDFTLYENGNNGAIISNSKSMSITINSKIKDDETYLNKCQSISKGHNMIFSNGTINSSGIVIYSIFYQDLDNNQNYSYFFFNKYDNNFKMLISNFNYDSQKDEIIDIVTNITDTMRWNYKNEQ